MKKKLYLSRENRVLAGVCGGLGKYFGIDPVFFRIGFCLAAAPGGVPGILIYIVMAVTVPQEEEPKVS